MIVDPLLELLVELRSSLRPKHDHAVGLVLPAVVGEVGAAGDQGHLLVFLDDAVEFRVDDFSILQPNDKLVFPVVTLELPSDGRVVDGRLVLLSVTDQNVHPTQLGVGTVE
nr:hypothetical protein [Natrinema pallidum]